MAITAADEYTAGVAAFKQMRLGDAQEHFETGLATGKAGQGMTTVRGNTFLKLADVKQKLGEKHEALQHAENAMLSFRDLYSEMGTKEDLLAQVDGSPSSVMTFINSGKDAEVAADGLLGEARALHWMGEHEGDLQLGQDHLNHALEIFEKLGDGIGQHKCFRALGALHLQADEYVLARRYLEVSLVLTRKHFKKSTKNSDEEGRTLRLLGDLSMKCKDNKAATDYYEGALPFFMGDAPSSQAQRAAVLFALGELHHEDPDTQGNYLQEALELYQELGEERGVNTTLLALGQLSLKAYTTQALRGDDVEFDDLESAETAFTVTLEYFRSQDGERANLASACSSLGIVYHMMGDEDQSQKMLLEAHDTYEKLGDQTNLARTEALVKSLSTLAMEG